MDTGSSGVRQKPTPEDPVTIPSYYRLPEGVAEGFDHVQVLLRECLAILGYVIDKELRSASEMLPRPQEPEEE